MRESGFYGWLWMSFNGPETGIFGTVRVVMSVATVHMIASRQTRRKVARTSIRGKDRQIDDIERNVSNIARSKAVHGSVFGWTFRNQPVLRAMPGILNWTNCCEFDKTS
ncbi:hypothetical protein [Burkholderia cenocepacia]|uniref:hypothetical protein n=1 Tax=Burkholderia cenocepacia TaxID=95486 RepID=UPI00196A9026|nr:hypothetical protein [Burkholderia cenocepacia]MBN3566342.1 hypothetical protein [Burkholderia cenocepacia]MBR8109805.1 hypothetical protein [Burkholderia cenocepacia]